jgi:hypothetical protein
MLVVASQEQPVLLCAHFRKGAIWIPSSDALSRARAGEGESRFRT